MRVGNLLRLLLGLTTILVAAGCHREVEDVPMLARMIGISDRFFDVQAIDADHTVVVGYGGKVLLTSDGGFTWSQAKTGVNRALYRVRFVDANNGWISGQEGLILHTTDGGKTWKRQKSGTDVYLFSLFFLDANTGFAAGDKAIILKTTDGGAHWVFHKVSSAEQHAENEAEALVSADPVLYDVQFLDANNGWVVGEFGKIFHSTDGGVTWAPKQQSLVGGDIVDELDLPTFFGVHFLNAQTGVAAGLDGRIARTDDGGNTWAFDKMKLDYPIIDPLFYPMIFPDGSGWVVGAAGEVVHRTSADAPWERAKLGMDVHTWLRGMSWRNQSDGWIVGGLGLILHTKDGGKSWLPSLG